MNPADGPASPPELEFGGLDLVDELEPLWLAMFDHHVAVGAGGLPVIPRELSWPRRREVYRSVLRRPDAFVLLARRAGRAVGYVVAHVHPGADDTWPTGTSIGEIESLAVAPAERGRGVGTLLLDRAEQRLALIGAHDVRLSVVNGNTDAMRFYERRGMTPVMVTYLRLRR